MSKSAKPETITLIGQTPAEIVNEYVSVPADGMHSPWTEVSLLERSVGTADPALAARYVRVREAAEGVVWQQIRAARDQVTTAAEGQTLANVETAVREAEQEVNDLAQQIHALEDAA